MVGAGEHGVEGVAGEDFRGVFGGRAVEGEQAVAEAEDPGFVFGIGGIRGVLVVEAGAGFVGLEAGGIGADGGEVGGVEAFGAGGDDALDGGQQDIGIAEVGPRVIGDGAEEPCGATVADAAGEGGLTIFPAGQRDGVADRELAADRLEAAGGDGRAFDAVTKRAVGVIPILENEKLASGCFGGIRPFEVIEGGFRGGAGWQEKHLAAAGEELPQGVGSGAGGEGGRPQDGGEVGGAGGAGARGIHPLATQTGQARRRGGQGEVVG